MCEGLSVLQAFKGAKAGYVFGTGEFGLGYYTDTTKMEILGDAIGVAASSQPQHAASEQDVAPPRFPRKESALAPSTSLPPCLTEGVPWTAGKPPTGEAGRNSNTEIHQQALRGSARATEEVSATPALHGAVAENGSFSRAELQSALGRDFGPGSSEPLPVQSEATEAGKQPEVEGAVPLPEAGEAKQRPRHYWGQALQYLEKSADVTRGELPALGATEDPRAAKALRSILLCGPFAQAIPCHPGWCRAMAL